jgi:hypothetical protein
LGIYRSNVRFIFSGVRVIGNPDVLSGTIYRVPEPRRPAQKEVCIMSAKLPFLHIIFDILKNPMAMISIVLPAVIFYFVIGSMPRGYQDAGLLVIYCLVLMVLAAYAQFDIAIKRYHILEKNKNINKMINDINNMLRDKTPQKVVDTNKKTNPVLAKTKHEKYKLNDEDCKEFQ